MRRAGKILLAVLPGALLAVPAWCLWPPAAAGVLGVYFWVEMRAMTTTPRGKDPK